MQNLFFLFMIVCIYRICTKNALEVPKGSHLLIPAISLDYPLKWNGLEKKSWFHMKVFGQLITKWGDFWIFLEVKFREIWRKKNRQARGRIAATRQVRGRSAAARRLGGRVPRLSRQFSHFLPFRDLDFLDLTLLGGGRGVVSSFSRNLSSSCSMVRILTPFWPCLSNEGFSSAAAMAAAAVTGCCSSNHFNDKITGKYQLKLSPLAFSRFFNQYSTR